MMNFIEYTTYFKGSKTENQNSIIGAADSEG